ncbi:MAG: ComEC family competence protein [Chitinophagaceae bacterium]|nr:ComEC family competence protein [Chitinophagaceae bacterium]
MKQEGIFFWKSAPFVKLLLAWIAGILTGWYVMPPFQLLYIFSGICLSVLLFSFISLIHLRFRYRLWISLSAFLLCVSAAAILTQKENIRNRKDYFEKFYQPGDIMTLTLEEPPVEKNKSYKANASIQYLVRHERQIPVSGTFILYFSKKDSLIIKQKESNKLQYGAMLVVQKTPQPIKNSGNPGAFDYERYCLFQGITHQFFLRSYDYSILNVKNENALKTLVFQARQKVVSILTKYISGNKERGLAEALLIGYKNDLDQTLVQSYTNTGVIHIIAISGLHIGIIYWLLQLVFLPLSRKKNMKSLHFICVIGGIWFFSLLAGAQPSVLRSAFMFTVLALGDTLNRKTSVYNSLAFSAFVLLCMHPFWLWDVGFQLSYAAVTSIFLFLKPIYHLFYFQNKILDFLWKINAVTLAAQILTLPLSIYHFHQFPVLFFISNFLAVPLSGIILIAEIVLIGFYFTEPVAYGLGRIIETSIRIMNHFIEQIEKIPGSLWDGLSVSFLQLFFLYFTIAFVSMWLFYRKTTFFLFALGMLLFFFGIRAFSFLKSEQQRKIIVYHVPGQTAIDFVDGRHYRFFGDSILQQEGFARNFHLKPSRILHRLKEQSRAIHSSEQGLFMQFFQRRILCLKNNIQGTLPIGKNPEIDLLVISKPSDFSLKEILQQFHVKQVVFDGAAPYYKTDDWKKTCDSLHVPWHDTGKSGAFVMNIR